MIVEMPTGAVTGGDREARGWRDYLAQILGVALGHIVKEVLGL